jgi:hypothetical protein
MFVIPEEAVTSRRAAEVFPQLSITDYPTTPNRLRKLTAYFEEWETYPFPFIDQRVVPKVPPVYRGAFVALTNTFYRRWMYGPDIEQQLRRSSAGQLDVCYSCNKQPRCKECCLVALNVLPKIRLNDNFRTVIYEVKAFCCTWAQHKVGVSSEELHLHLPYLYEHVPYRKVKHDYGVEGVEGTIDGQRYRWESGS